MPRQNQVQVRIEAVLLERVDAAARRAGLTRESWARKALLEMARSRGAVLRKYLDAGGGPYESRLLVRVNAEERALLDGAAAGAGLGSRAAWVRAVLDMTADRERRRSAGPGA